MHATWTAFLAADPAPALDKLGWVAMGNAGVGYDETEMLVIPSGWRVIVERDHKEPSSVSVFDGLADDALTGYCTTVAMGSQVQGRGWKVYYDCSRDEPMKATGALPAAYTAALARAEASGAADDDDLVDYMWSVPLEVSQAICGYHAEEEPPPGTEVWALEPRAKGASAAAQMARQQAWGRLTAGVKDHLYTKIASLGFSPQAQHPDATFAAETNGFLRRRGDTVDELMLRWGVGRDGPQITLLFATRGDPRTRLNYGQASTPLMPRPGPIQRLMGAKPPPPEQGVEQAVERAAGFVAAIESYLRDGVEHPDLTLPRYYPSGR